MKRKTIETVLAHHAKQLEKKENEINSLREKVFQIPEISKAQANFVNLSFSYLDKSKNISKEDIENAHKKYILALKKYGYEEKDFTISYNCPKCCDTGFNNGKLCNCIWDEYINQLEKDCNILNSAPFTFKDCNLNIIKNEEQKKAIKNLYNAMYTYVNKYPNINIHTITLCGKTGTGKSALASAMARQMVQNGNSALFLSAYEFNNLMLKVLTAPIEEKHELLKDILTCDMLVIDDLGTEPMIKKVTIEYLLLVLEERLNNKLSTVITTNLSVDKIMSRYYERIYSRLADKAHSKIFELKGLDLRL